MWKAKLIKIKGLNRNAVQFDKTPSNVIRFKQIEGAQWNQGKACWHIPDTAENRVWFNLGLDVELTDLEKRGLKNSGMGYNQSGIVRIR